MEEWMYDPRLSMDGRESSEEKIEKILDCLVQMNEQYRYILCRLNGGEE